MAKTSIDTEIITYSRKTKENKTINFQNYNTLLTFASRFGSIVIVELNVFRIQVFLVLRRSLDRAYFFFVEVKWGGRILVKHKCVI